VPIDDVEFANLVAGHLGPKARALAGRLDPALRATVGATRGEVWLSAYTYQKQRIKHPDVDFRAYRLLPVIIRDALVFRQGARRLIFLSNADNAAAKHFRLCIKHARAADELYVESFHPLWPKDFRRLSKRAEGAGAIIRAPNSTA
jgi:hypothetical protein